MLIPHDTAERRITHKGNVIYRLHVDFAGMVKVIVEEKREGVAVKIGEELQFPKSTWEKYEKK